MSKNFKDELGERIKNNYENVTRYILPKRTYTIIRLDGKAFHTYTRGLNRPFDDGLIEDMDQTSLYLLEKVQNCVLAYTQSDEITLVLTDFEKNDKQAWFEQNLQKMCSISASLATAKFNQLRLKRSLGSEFDYGKNKFLHSDYLDEPLALFDSRVYTISSRNEVINNLIWRQKDAVRNSINMLAQSLYSHKELHGKSSSQQQELCFQKGINWDSLPVRKKRGGFACYINKNIEVTKEQFNKAIGENNDNVFWSAYSEEHKEEQKDGGYYYIKRKKPTLIECPHFTIDSLELSMVLPFLQ